MRHLLSLIAGIVLAPVAWLLLATGQRGSQATIERWDAAGAFDTIDLVGPVLVLLATGILLGLLATLRWSPAGPLVAGVLLVAPTIVLLINPFRLLDRVSDDWRLLGQDLTPRLPVENGTLLVLGALLLMAVFSVQRWRRWPVRPAPVPTATDEEAVAGTDALTGDPEQSTPPEAEPEDRPAPVSGEPGDGSDHAAGEEAGPQEPGEQRPDPA